MKNEKLKIKNEGKIFRIIDVNLNRATEGLRVVEEVCRFILEDAKLTLEAKQLRGRLSRVIRHELASRNAAGDVGREPYTKNEQSRAGLENIFKANIKRAEEAVRCLEEFSKLLKASYGKAFKTIRFEIYELEKKLTPRLSKALKLDFDLYVVTDELKGARRAIAGGVKIVQYRDKQADKKAYLKTARRLATLTKKSGAALILNDHWDLVKEAGADGVNVGQEDLKKTSFATIRKRVGADAIVGVSVSSLSEALRAQKLGADYVGVGPIFATPIKKGAGSVGLTELKKIVNRLSIPVVAIGGIDMTNVKKVLGTGCPRIAVIRAAGELIRDRAKLWQAL
jgi:thiamine-phosphate pyrophosphorylase